MRADPTTAPTSRMLLALITALATAIAVLALAPPATADPEGPVRLISATDMGLAGDDQSHSPGISADGRYVVFMSEASDLTPEADANAASGGADIFTYDRMTGATTLVSRNLGGTASGDGTSTNPVMTPDGRYIAFSSRASDLATEQAGGDGQNDQDVFVWDRTNGTTVLVSESDAGDGACTAGVVGSFSPSISDDGRYVAFQSDCGDLTGQADDNGFQDVFLWDRTTADITAMSFRGVASNGFSQNPRINGDGTHVAFQSLASNISAIPDANGTMDVYLWVIGAGASTPISTVPITGATGNGASADPQISRDGQYVAYSTSATDVTTATDANGQDDVVVFSVADVGNTLVSHAAGDVDVAGDGGSSVPRISADGSTIAYVTAATDTAGGTDANGSSDVIVYDRAGRTAERASRTPTGAAADGQSTISFTTYNPQKLSDDGRYTIFESTAADMVDGVTGSVRNIFTYDRTSDTVALVSPASTGAGGGDDDSLQPVISADGSAAAFTSEATNLAEGDPSAQRDVYALLGEVVIDGDAPTLSIAGVTALEGQSGPIPFDFVVTLSPAAAGEVTVDYATIDMTATAPSDYAARTGTLTFPPGDTTATITVDVVGDTEPEPDETFAVVLSNPTGGAVITGMAATGTILDDDEHEGPPGGGAVADDREGVNDTIRIHRPGAPPTTSEVALRYSQATFPDGGPMPSEVLLATDGTFADALASGALQTTRTPEGKITGGRPLLLTPTDVLSPEVLGELTRLGATSIRILGGVVAISQTVEDELRAMGYRVDRYAGPTRLETATDIAARGFPTATTAVLARAFPAEGAADDTQAFADSLAAGAWAASEGWPLLLTQTAVLSDSTRAYVEGSGITTVRVVGGAAAIEEGVLDSLRAMGLTVDRVEGLNRVQTALAIAAQRGYASEVDADRVIVIDGQGPEAWAGGFAAAAHSALHDAPVLLGTAEVIPEETAAFLRGPAADFTVDEGNITGPVLVCAIAGERCEEVRLLLGLPELAALELDDDGQTVVRGSVLSGAVRVAEEGVTVQPTAGCLGETSPTAVPASPDPTPLSVPLPADARLGPCDIAFVVLFPNGSLQTIIQSIQVTAAP